MDISVIVLTFNQEKTIGRALDSVLSQITDADFEIIVGDDASTDSTGEICEKYQKAYPDKIRYIRREKNLGVVKNYFDCVAKARGKYIADCAGDDYWSDPEKLERQFKFLETHPEVALVSGEWRSHNVITNEISIVDNAALPGEYGKENMVDMFTSRMVVNLCASLYRKEFVLEMMAAHPEIMMPTDFKFEDLQVLLTCATKGKIVVLPGVVHHYSVGHESLSHPKSCLQRFLYSSRTSLQMEHLKNFFLKDISSKEKSILLDHSRKKGDYLYAMAFKAGPQQMKAHLNDLKDIKVKGIKGSLYAIIMNSEFLWKTALKFLKH